MIDYLHGISWEYLIRLLVAGILGAAVGLEREYRAKEAGYRTHFMVCVGSALMMIISKYGFSDIIGDPANAVFYRLDPARIAAQVVTGIGFIGVGTIIIQKHAVRGLTTAAGIWATAGIGLAIGAGMYVVGLVATVFVLICLESLGRLSKKVGSRRCSIEFSSTDKESVEAFNKYLADRHFVILYYEMNQSQTGLYQVSTIIRIRNYSDEQEFFAYLTSVGNISLHRLE